MKKEIVIVLININAYGSCGENARHICERIEGEFIEDFDNYHDLASLSFPDGYTGGGDLYQTWSLSDFTLAFNDQLVNDSHWFISWVFTTKK